MKYTVKAVIPFLILHCSFFIASAQVAINTDNATPDASAILDVKSTNKGMLMPRMTSTQRAAISSPATGLLVYQTDSPEGIYEYNGTKWMLTGSFLSNGSLTTSSPANRLPILDAQQTILDDALLGRLNNNGQWQSFTAENTGLLKDVEIGYIGIPSGPTIKIYRGEGTSGTELVSETFSGSSINNSFIRYTFTNSVPVIAGQKYTINVSDNTGIWGSSSSDIYTGGVASSVDISSRSDGDFAFKTYVILTEFLLINVDSINGGVRIASSNIYVDSIGNTGIGTITPDDKLDVEGNIRINDNDIYLRGGTDKNHALGWYGAGKTFEMVNVDGPVLYGFSGGLLGTNQTNNQNIALAWKANGRVGIGGNTNPSVSLDVEGSIEYTGTIMDVSDSRLKENLLPVTTVLPKLLQLQAYTYNMKNDETQQREYGLLAQEVQSLFPELVATIDEEEEYLGVSYVQLIPVLIEAVKELKTENEALKAENKAFKTQNSAFEQRLAKIEALLQTTATTNQ